MPTSSQINTARNQILANLQSLRSSNPVGYETAILALLSLIADNAGTGGGGGGGGSSSTQYTELDPLNAVPSVGTVALFRRADGVLKAIQGDNSDRLKVAGEVSLATGSSIAISNFPSTQVISGGVSISNFPATQAVSLASLPALPTGTNAIGSVSISNFPATQPVSVAALPLPTGAASDSTLSTLSGKLPASLVAGRLSVDGSGVTQPVSAAALPLPTGAATSAKQPALGVAGNASNDVITVQGIAGGTPQSVRLTDGASAITVQASSSDATIDSTNRVPVASSLFGFNGTNFDRLRTGISGAISSVLGFLNVLPVGRYNATSPTLTDGQWLSLQLSQNGALRVTQTDSTPVTEAALTAVGTTTARNVSGYRNYSYQLNVSGIGTSVTVRVEGTLRSAPTATDWYNLNGTEDLFPITANGAYKIQINSQVDLQIRLNLVSFSGGTPSVTATLVLGN